MAPDQLLDLTLVESIDRLFDVIADESGPVLDGQLNVVVVVNDVGHGETLLICDWLAAVAATAKAAGATEGQLPSSLMMIRSSSSSKRLGPGEAVCLINIPWLAGPVFGPVPAEAGRMLLAAHLVPVLIIEIIIGAEVPQLEKLAAAPPYLQYDGALVMAPACSSVDSGGDILEKIGQVGGLQPWRPTATPAADTLLRPVSKF